MRKSGFQNAVLTPIILCIIIMLALLGREKKKPAQDKEQPLLFCTIMPSSFKYIDPSRPRLEMVGDPYQYWKKRLVLRIYFFDGSDEVIDELLNTIYEWTAITGIRFERVFSKYDSAEIRTCFGCPGYNSLVGTQSYDPLYDHLPTMSLEGLDKTTDKTLFRRVILHEFGHALGFLHETQNPTANIPWDTLKLYRYYDSVYHWKPDSVNKWVLAPYLKAEYSPFDTASIMMYAIPREVTKGGYYIQWPLKISTQDKKFAKAVYH
jgi:hypothetical protein